MEHQKLRIDSDVKIQTMQRDIETKEHKLRQMEFAEQTQKDLCQQQEQERQCLQEISENLKKQLGELQSECEQKS